VIEQTGSILPMLPSLKDAVPRDRAHILRCVAPDYFRLEHLCLEQNGRMASYRADLIGRLQGDQARLALNYRLDQEIDAIRQICSQHRNYAFVLLTELDCLVTYLKAARDGSQQVFLKKLELLRQLETPLWILFPPRLIPDQWPSERMIDFKLQDWDSSHETKRYCQDQ